MAEKKNGNITNTELVKRAGIGQDQTAWDEFFKTYVSFLTKIMWRGCIFAGRRKCTISAPDQNMKDVIIELESLMLEVCHDFLTTKVTPEFIESIQKTHRGKAEPQKHYSVRTTLQIMFVNKLKKNPPPSLIVNFTGTGIDIYIKNGSKVDGPPITIVDKEETREQLRHLRCFLTRLAGKGNISVYPTPYECYCLYHDCFGTDRKEVVQAYVSNPEAQQEFLDKTDWNDATVGALVKHRYEGKRQLRNKRKISCERKTVNNRRQEYQELLSKCIRHYLPDADPEMVRQILDKRDVDFDTIIDFGMNLIQNVGMQKPEVAEKMKTRTLEMPK